MKEISCIMSLKQAASYLGISEPTMKRRIKSKQIKAYKDGGYWKIKKEWVIEYQNGLLKKAGVEEDNSLKNIKEGQGLSIEQFSQETQDFIYKLCANAIKRAIKNGEYRDSKYNRGIIEPEMELRKEVTE